MAIVEQDKKSGAGSSTTFPSAAFEAQLVENMDILYRVALGLTRNPFDAQDLLQEAIARALKFHYRFKEGTYFKAWMLTIVRNTFINDYRKKSRRPQTVHWQGEDMGSAPPPDPEMGYFPGGLKSKLILEFLDDDVRDAVEALPEGHRNAVIMADLKSMSYKEIADELGCPLGTVMSRLHRGRRLLRVSLASRRPEAAFS